MIFVGKLIMNQHCKAKKKKKKSRIYQAVRFIEEGTILCRTDQVIQDALGIQWVGIANISVTSTII